jgi:hypothetical protein
LFLLFQNALEFCRAYFLSFKLGNHQNALLLFHRLIFSTSESAFSHRNLIHSTQLSLFQQQFYFPLMPSQKAITLASADAVRGANFAIAKFRDAYGSPLEAIVGRSRYRGEKEQSLR